MDPVRRHWGRALVLVVLAVAAMVIILRPDRADTIGPLAVLVGYATAGVTLARRTRSLDDRERFAWRLVAAGFLTAALGIMVVAILEIVTGSVPAFGPTDILFIVTYLLILAGFGLLPHMSTSMIQRVRIYLDSLVGAISVAAVMWVLVLDHLILDFAAASAWDRWAGAAYPILDVAALMMVVIVSVRRSTYRFDLRLLLFALGIIAQVTADLTYLWSGVGRTFAEANPNFLVFLLAATLYFVAATIVDRPPKARAYADRRASLMSMLAPYTAAVILVGLLLVETRDSALATNAKVVLAATLIVGLLVIVRQTVAIHENRMLVERQRTDLVSSISHELRTPLTAVVGFLDVLSDPDAGLSEAERHELTLILSQQTAYMSRIVSDLVLLARGSPDELTLKENVMPVAGIVDKALKSVEQKATSVDTEIDAALQARIDGGRVQQILVNLLSNAVRYGNGRSLVVIRREGDDLAIEVHDNGPGVPKKYELAIWEKFERGVNRYNAATPGSGIGLAVVDVITRAHQGSAGYQRSDRLGGACFRVVLPRRAIVA